MRKRSAAGMPGPTPSDDAARKAEERQERLKALLGRAAAALGEMAITGYDASRAIRAKPIEWLWQGRIARHHVVELCGPSGEGKSSLAFLLAAAASAPPDRPAELFGAVVKPLEGDRLVLLVNEENSEQSTVFELDAALEMLGVDPVFAWERRLYTLARQGVKACEVPSDDVRSPPTTSPWANVVHAAHNGAFGLIILDTRARIFSGFGSSKEEDVQANVARCISDLQRVSDAPIVVISHTRKGGAGGLEDVSGSAQRAAAADVVLMIAAEKEDGRVVSSRVTFEKVRDSFGEHPPAFTFSKAKGDAGRWTLSLNASARPEDKPAHERVLDLLAASPHAMTKAEIRKGLPSMSGDRLNRAIELLKAERRISWRKERGEWVASTKEPLRGLGVERVANDTGEALQ